MSRDETETQHDLLTLTAEVVVAHLSKSSVPLNEIPDLITSVHSALAGLGKAAQVEQPKQEPAVPIRSSVKHDYLICLEDGAKLKMLKRYLRTQFGMSPDEYRAKWDLPRDYPMVAPAYAERRKELALKAGLGRKPVSDQKETESELQKPKRVRAKSQKNDAV